MPSQTTSRLGTRLKFRVFDMRGIRDFPSGFEGVVYHYTEDRTIQCKLTGLDIKRKGRYVILCGPDHLWRIDLIPSYNAPAEAVYSVSGEAKWKTPQEAAKALSGTLDHIRDNTTKGT